MRKWAPGLVARPRASITPPWSRTMPKQMPSPRPVPFSLVVKNGSNTRERRCSGMPGPVSLTRITRSRPFKRVWKRMTRSFDLALTSAWCALLARLTNTCCQRLTSTGNARDARVEVALDADVVHLELVLVQARSTDSMTSFRFARRFVMRDWRANVSRFSTIRWQRRALRSTFSMSPRAHCSTGRPRQQLRVAEDARERVVQLVRHAARRASRWRSASRTASSLLLQLALARAVAREHHDALRVAVVADERLERGAGPAHAAARRAAPGTRRRGRARRAAPRRPPRSTFSRSGLAPPARPASAMRESTCAFS